MFLFSHAVALASWGSNVGCLCDRLVVAAADFVPCKNRSCAIGRRRRVRMMSTLLRRLYGLVESQLMEALFVLCDIEFPREWFYRFLCVAGGSVVLRLID